MCQRLVASEQWKDEIMVTGVRIEGHQVVGAQIRMERSQTPLTGGNDSARARLGSVVSALRNDSGQLRSGYLRLAANQDGSFQMRAGHSLLGKSEQARARDYVLQTIKDAYGDVPGMDQAINRYLSSGQSGGKLGTVSTLKLIRSLEEMRLQTTGKSEGGSDLLDQTAAITVGAGKTGRLATDFVASAQASWKQAEHLSQGWAKLAPQVHALHVDINQALSEPELNSDDAKSLMLRGLALSQASDQLKPLNPKNADFAIKQAWLKTPEGQQMTDQLQAAEWKIALLGLADYNSDLQAKFNGIQPGQDHSALRQELTKSLARLEGLSREVTSNSSPSAMKEMDKRLPGSQTLNTQLKQALGYTLLTLRSVIKMIDDLPTAGKDSGKRNGLESQPRFLDLIRRFGAEGNAEASGNLPDQDEGPSGVKNQNLGGFDFDDSSSEESSEQAYDSTLNDPDLMRFISGFNLRGVDSRSPSPRSAPTYPNEKGES